IFPLQINLRPAQLLGKPPRKRQRRRTPRISPQQLLQPPLKLRVALRLLILPLQLLQRRHQSLGNIPPAINPKPPRNTSQTLRTLIQTRVPHPCAFFAQGGDFDFPSPNPILANRRRSHRRVTASSASLITLSFRTGEAGEESAHCVHQQAPSRLPHPFRNRGRAALQSRVEPPKRIGL